MPKPSSIRGAKKKNPDTKVELTGGDLDVVQESGFYEAYAGFANNLRTWFIAYGIGAPVVLISQDHAWNAIAKSGLGYWIAVLFFSGVAIQIVGALMYKTTMWYLYVGELKPKFQETRRHKVADFLSENYLIEAGLDVVTAGLFGWASIKTLQVITIAL